MTNLPITPSTVTSAAGQQPASATEDATLPSGEQAFSAVLARQFSGAASDNASALGQVLSKLDLTGKGTGAETTDTSQPVVDLPADMLATLLAQYATPQAATSATDQTLSNPAAASDREAAATQLDSAPLIALVSPDQLPRNTQQLDVTAEAGNVQTIPDTNMEQPTSLSQATPRDNGLNSALRAELPVHATIADNASSARSPAVEMINLAQAGATPATNQTASNLPQPIAIDTAVGQPGWGQELGQKITWIASQRDQSAELHLNPPQLGPLDVTLKVSGDQATAVFASPHAAVREAIEQALPKLREMLADSGIMLGNATVNDQSTRKEQEPQARPAQISSEPANQTVPDHQIGSGTTTIRHHNGLVDTFA